MYNNTSINPAELYGINKGFAQVIDLSRMDRNAQLAEAQAEREQRQQEHEDQLKQADLEHKLAKLGNNTRHADDKAVADKVSKYQDLVYDKFSKAKGGKLSIQDELELNEALRGVNSYIDQSNLVGQKQLALASTLKGDEWGHEDFVKSLNMPMDEMEAKGGYIGYAPQTRGDMQKEFNQNYMKRLIDENAMTGDANYNSDGSVTYTNVRVLDPARVEETKRMAFKNSPLAIKELSNRNKYDTTFGERYSNKDSGAVDYEQAYVDAIWTPKAEVDARTGATQKESKWEWENRTGNSAKSDDVPVNTFNSIDGTQTMSFPAPKKPIGVWKVFGKDGKEQDAEVYRIQVGRVPATGKMGVMAIVKDKVKYNELKGKRDEQIKILGAKEKEYSELTPSLKETARGVTIKNDKDNAIAEIGRLETQMDNLPEEKLKMGYREGMTALNTAYGYKGEKDIIDRFAEGRKDVKYVGYEDVNKNPTNVKGKDVPLPKSYSAEQEAKISKNLKANPAYTREEIIQALGY